MTTVGGIKDPEESKTWKGIFRGLAGAHRQEPLWDGPIRMDLLFELDRPKGTKKGTIWRKTKPDLDNLEKAVKDALEGVIYTNDARIVSKGSEKIHVGILSTVAGVTVRLERLPEEDPGRWMEKWRS